MGLNFEQPQIGLYCKEMGKETRRGDELVLYSRTQNETFSIQNLSKTELYLGVLTETKDKLKTTFYAIFKRSCYTVFY